MGFVWADHVKSLSKEYTKKKEGSKSSSKKSREERLQEFLSRAKSGDYKGKIAWILAKASA